MQEDDSTINARIDSLMDLFRKSDSEETNQIILNSLETYKKLLICETSLQNKFSGKTLDSLIKALLVVMCHRKDFDHLNSMVRSTSI